MQSKKCYCEIVLKIEQDRIGWKYIFDHKKTPENSFSIFKVPVTFLMKTYIDSTFFENALNFKENCNLTETLSQWTKLEQCFMVHV